MEDPLPSCAESGRLDASIETMIHNLNKEYRSVAHDALCNLILVLKQMSEYKISATTKATKTGITQWRECLKYIKA